MSLTTFKLRRGTASQWTTTNYILADGEPGFERDTKRFKIGDGSTTWNNLEYYLSETAVVNMLAQPGNRLADATLGAAYAAKSVQALAETGRLSDVALSTKISDQITNEAFVYGTTVDTAAQGNDPRLVSVNLNASIILETSIGVWTADAPSRVDGEQKIIFIGVSDPADVTNGVDTPANINPTDIWLARI